MGIDIKYDKATLKNYKVIHQGDFVISLRSFQGGFELSDKLGITSPAYTIFVPKSMDSQDNLFWKTKFKTFTFIESLKTVTFGIRDGKSISFSEFGDLKLFFPKNIEEQQKIGNFFKQLDDTIALHQRQLENYQKLKKAMLQKMFPENGVEIPKIRFNNFTEKWKQRKLGEVSSKVTKKNKDRRYEETLTNSAELGIVPQSNFFDKEISNKSNIDGYYIVQPDNFVYNPRISNFAPVGPIKRNNLGRGGVMSPLYYVFSTNHIDNNYLEKYFDTTHWHRFMKLNGDSGARADRFAIRDSIFIKMPIPYPSMKEQEKIGEFLKTFDSTIALHQNKIKEMEKLKQACLSKMFI
ncbi:type I restriction enzyme, S subunit [Pisciglobus halotolerans]|uniref:Type I restriction enzyme, S subunit n=1 Tax=Pisciglobus halotolerans TaxID=745365 RepID=A0A1I3B3M1_9LACT|nr:type I restriction enzyme, S subunit [Pisciglobus halotolerans]